MSSIVTHEERQIARPLSVLVALIQKDLEQANDAAKRASMPYYKSAGDKMLEAKGQLSRGEFVPWLRRNFSITEQTARRYMSFAVATRDTQNEGNPSFSSLNDFHKQTGSSAYREVTSKKDWHDDIKSNIDRARAEAKRIQNEHLTKQREREEEKRLALKLIDIGFKVLAKELHPDKGGTRDAMSRLSRVRDRLKSHA